MSLANPPRMSVSFEAKALTVELAAELGVDIQSICENALRAEVARRFKEENRAAAEAWNGWVEQNGLPLEKYRMF